MGLFLQRNTNIPQSLPSRLLHKKKILLEKLSYHSLFLILNQDWTKQRRVFFILFVHSFIRTCSRMFYFSFNLPEHSRVLFPAFCQKKKKNSKKMQFNFPIQSREREGGTSWLKYYYQIKVAVFFSRPLYYHSNPLLSSFIVFCCRFLWESPLFFMRTEWNYCELRSKDCSKYLTVRFFSPVYFSSSDKIQISEKCIYRQTLHIQTIKMNIAS